MQSRRASPRIPYDEAVCLTRADGNGRLYGRGMDIGTGGMMLVCADGCSVDTAVRCDLLLPGGPRPVGGRVVRVTPAPGGFELAIAFEDSKPGTVGLIEEMVAAVERSPNVIVSTQEDVLGSGAIRRVAVDPPSGDGVPRAALQVDTVVGQHDETQPYGKARPAPAAEPAPLPPPIPPTSLPPLWEQSLPSVVVAPELGASLGDGATPTPALIPPPPPPPPAKDRPAKKKPGGPAAMRGTAVVARRPDAAAAAAWAWQQPAVLVAAPAATVTPRRTSLLDAPLSARSLVVLAPILALVVAAVVQLSR